MSQYLAFFTEAVVSGRILGVDASCTPDDVTRVLGQYAENREPTTMWRDYGTIEFFWERASAAERWQGTHVSLQVHRLNDDPTQMNELVRHTYGEFDTRLRFDELDMAVAQTGARLVKVPRMPPDEVRQFVRPDTAVTVLVVAVGDAGRPFVSP